MGSTEAVIAIIVAIIGGSGVPVWFLTKLDRKNTEQHGESRAVLDSIRADMTEVKSDVSEVKGNLIDHLNYHLEADRDGSARGTKAKPEGAKVRGGNSVSPNITPSKRRTKRTD